MAAAADPDYFPLAVGNRWEYREDRSPASQIIEVIRTEQLQGLTWYVVRWRGPSAASTWMDEHWLRVDQQRRLVELKADRINTAVWVRFDDSTLPYDSSMDPCSRRATTTANGREVRVGFLMGVCADAGLMWQVYTDGVGLREFTHQSIRGPVTWRLVRARVGGKDLTF